MKSVLTICLLMVFISNGFAQFYESGQDPASIKWRQINTPHVQIIFPQEFDSAANRLANTFDYIYTNTGKGLNCSPRKISVVLHNHSVNSNGFVTLAPRRMELYTTPPQTFTAQDWMNELALHEYRHVAQLGKLSKGIPRLLYPFMGQQVPGAVAGLLPRWFLEGDAVYAETMHSNCGRGRTGNFTMEINTLVNEQPKLFSFEKMLMGSYRDYIPNHYHSGYFLVSKIRAKYGNAVFEHSLNYVARNPYIPYSFSHSLKRETGKNSRNLYKEIFKELKDTTNENTDKSLEYRSTVNSKNNGFTSFNYPLKLDDFGLLTIKSGLGTIPSFTRINTDGSEQTLFTPGKYTQTRFSYADGKIAWSEEIPDIRWSNRSYSCIKIFDIRNQHLTQLTHKTRYFAAALSTNANLLATVEVTLQNKFLLVLLNLETGQMESNSPAPGNLLISDPVFSKDNKSVIMVLTGDKGKALYSFDLTSHLWKQLTQYTFHTLSNPVEWNGYILYSADYSGKNDIYALDTYGKIFRVTQSTNGAFEPNILSNDSTLYFSNYTSQGYTIRFQNASPSKWEPYTAKPVYSDSLILSGTTFENFNLQDSINNSEQAQNKLLKTNTSNRYSKYTHMFNLHSWAPFYYNYSNLELSNQNLYPGFTLLSQDKLGTLVSSLSAAIIEGNWYLKPRLTYKGMWPVLDISADFGGYVPYNSVDSVPAPPTKKGRVRINSLLYVPLNLTKGKYISGITPLLETNYDNRRYYNYKSKEYNNNIILSSFGFNAYSYLKTSVRDIAPKLGFYFSARYLFTPFEKDKFGYLYYVKPRLYLPGLFKHHSLQIAGGYQYQNPIKYLFASQIPYVRGYSTNYSFETEALWLDYNFPICYPDLAIGSLIYFKRIRADLFADFATNKYRTNNTWIYQNLSSMGIDFLTDFHVLRIFFPITGGVREVFLPAEKIILTQFILRADFNY